MTKHSRIRVGSQVIARRASGVNARTAADVEAAFLCTIREHPNDDTPRLIYADWLDEHDNGNNGYASRAEFIRVQCQLAGTEKIPNRRDLGDREQELLRKHRQEWMQPLRAIVPGLRDEDVTFARGLPAGILLHRIEDLEPVERLAALFPLQQIHLELQYNAIGEAGARALATSPHLQHLTHLYVYGNHIGVTGARALVQSPHLAHLMCLALSGGGIGEAGAQALATSPHLAHLTYLDLGGGGIGDAGARALAESPHLRQLTHLDLSGNRIGEAGARALAESPHLRQLIHLDLSGNRIGEAALSNIEREMTRRREQARGRRA